MADKVIKVDESIFERLNSEIELFNELAEKEYKDQYKLADAKQRRQLKKPIKISLKQYTETALLYFLKNHVDPRTLGEETDVIAEVRKLRNNVFSFMQVQERNYLMPFLEDVYKLKNQSGMIEENSYDMLNLMEIFIDLMLSGLGLSAKQQEEYRARAAKRFSEKKATYKPR